jgi:hypothetical protein
MANLLHSLLGMFWPIIEHQAQLISGILSRMTFLHFYQANFAKLATEYEHLI